MKKTIEEIREELKWLGFVGYVHEVGDYQIAEYRDKYNHEIYYHPYHNGNNMSVSYETIEECMVGMVARVLDGPNTRIDKYFMNALKYEKMQKK